MTKLKNALVLLLVFLLVALGAVLPGAAARVQDTLTAGQVQYAQVDSLQLTLEERRQTLQMQEKLSLLLNGTGVEVTSEVTNMNGAKMLEAMYAQLQPYTAMGFLPEDMASDNLEFYPVMVYSYEDPEIYNFYWYVNMAIVTDRGDWLTAILDDETGLLLAVEYVNPDLFLSGEILYEYQDIMAQTYFNNLGLEPVDAMVVDSEGMLGEPMESVNGPGDAHIVIGYQLVDVLYGEVSVEITVHTNGFSISPL